VNLEKFFLTTVFFRHILQKNKNVKPLIKKSKHSPSLHREPLMVE